MIDLCRSIMSGLIGPLMITVFIISTGDNWQDIMTAAMDSTGIDQSPVRDASGWAAAYFVFVVLVAMLRIAPLIVVPRGTPLGSLLRGPRNGYSLSPLSVGLRQAACYRVQL